ncbi:hypothetical protein J1C67_11465 [Clostridium gasigenes]|uniref:hypothetical protein n=1 Tax=Clostridium gasigenes TaxID=94869 RepID=UPI0014384487|nr:hypothetical protein [Clostridium gasigenes]NKF07204.1 hypothetical protein [Clostridium gasigenes]QSW18186.1 hypothetical protein J1C67_11465 [Clostridium gasigenes]
MSLVLVVSEYDSKNLMNTVIEKVLENECYSHISYAMNRPLRLLIKDTSLLTEEEIYRTAYSYPSNDFKFMNSLFDSKTTTNYFVVKISLIQL